jgi:serine/threonine protein kinase
MILERGALLNNRYRIVEILGQGGMGSVYRAIDENLGVEVAVKDNLFTTDEYARQFRREAIILANLRHPNLPRVTDHFIIPGQGQYLVMDYIEGEDLRQRMERVGILPEEEVIVIGAAVCDALSYLGSRKPPVIHRDLKPGNVKITPQGEIFLVDFGLAKTLQGSQATTTGARAMTPGYSPPEQYGTARTDQRSDIFSLGATLYAALTGATPEDALARAMDQADLTPLRKLNPRVSRRLAAVIEKALEVRPDDRYQTAEEFKQALLGANTNVRRRDGGYSVSPPPSTEEEKLALAEPGSASAQAEEKISRPEIKSPPLLPVSTPLTDAPPQPKKSRLRKKSQRRSCLVTLLMLLVIMGLVGFLVYRNDPQVLNRAYAYWPTIATFFPDGARNVGATRFIFSETPAPNNLAEAPTETLALAALATASPTPSPSWTPTETIAPTETPTLIPTPLGGGAGQIAFASNEQGISQIFVINSDGSGRRQITKLPEGACQPDWSPDGKRLVFISPCSGNTDYYPGSAMYIINEDGSGLLPLPTLSGGDYDPKWSPDGKRIVFTSLRNSGRPQIYILNLEDNSVRAISERYNTDFQPEWSPDMKEIIFVTERRTGKQVWVMNADGSNARPFTRSNGMLNSRPSWSPDGKTVIYTQYVAENSVPRVNIAPYTFESFTEYRVSDLPMRDAVYSPDGYWLAFEGWVVGGSHNIYIMTSTGVSLTPITDDSVLDFDPVWRPITQ